ncbi:MAG: hypothetical protein PVG79_15665 [Gemmatimonadales bacterium]|jgi:hypothetical protein
MTDFAEVLRPLRARLPLPQPARTRVVLEIAADLEDMYRHYRALGLSEEEARVKAVEACDLSDEALAELVRVHTSSFRRLLDRLSAQAQSRWERGLLLIVAGTLTFVCLQVVVRGELVAVAGPQVWPSLICGLAGLTLGLAKFYQIYIKQDHELRRARRGLDAIMILAGAQVILGFLAAWFGLYLAARRITDDVEYAIVYLFNWLLGSAALLSVSLMGALLTAMVWFALARRVAGIAEAEAALLS